MDSPLWRSRRIFAVSVTASTSVRDSRPPGNWTSVGCSIQLSIKIGIFRGDFIVGPPFEFAKVDLGRSINDLDRASPLAGNNSGASQSRRPVSRLPVLRASIAERATHNPLKPKSKTSVSEISTLAPNVSPVIPPMRRRQYHPQIPDTAITRRAACL